MARRIRVIETLTPLLVESYRVIASEDALAAITYSATWIEGEIPPVSAGEYADAIARSLEATRRIDYERRMTTVGPHRDEPGFSISGRDARTQASQGEQRTLALGMKLAAHQAITNSLRDTPVLLLDDVFSELDPKRARALAGALPQDTQTLVTSARPEDLPISGKTWSVGDGDVG